MTAINASRGLSMASYLAMAIPMAPPSRPGATTATRSCIPRRTAVVWTAVSNRAPPISIRCLSTRATAAMPSPYRAHRKKPSKNTTLHSRQTTSWSSSTGFLRARSCMPTRTRKSISFRSAVRPVPAKRFVSTPTTRQRAWANRLPESTITFRSGLPPRLTTTGGRTIG